MNRSFDDIVPPEKRSIRKVEVQKSARSRRSVPRREAPQEEEKDITPRPPHVPRTRRGGSKWGLWVVAVVALLALIFGFSLVFSGAKVVVTPKQRTVLVDATFEAYRAPAIQELGFETMMIDREGEEQVPPSGEESVEEKASGTIVVYNDHSSANQRLIKNTRFETPEGLIYRINESIVVPGQKKEDGKTVPGSIEVTVYADEAGEGYNIGLTDFTIPGFEGDPRFETFYARSKSDMSGGFQGVRSVVSEQDEAQARASIQARLREQLTQEALSQKPEGFELFEDGIFVTFNELPQKESGDDVFVREKATLYGVLFKQEDFSAFVARNTIAGFDDQPVTITDPQSLSLTIVEKDSATPWEDDAVSFTLSGNAHIVWTFDTEQLKEDLAGKAKGALETVLTGYPSIDEAQIVLRPFWRQTFPEEVKDIKVAIRADE